MRRVALLVVALVGCGLIGPDNTTIQVNGVVVAAADGSPIANATVGAWEIGLTSSTLISESSTDGQGRYSLSFVEEEEGCFEGLLLINANAPGFEGVSKNKAFGDSTYIRCTEEPQTIDFQLERTP